ncbi:hypothetical protein M918_17770 [Clostridium sp. BL8]|nr:ABC transporter ATP-binding protein [Clostridium sp. BL8]EQB85748.1 hypothetical protein M918_17770 [Clostridium sp. BL8]
MSYSEYSSRSKDSYISNLINDINNIQQNYFTNFSELIVATGTFVFSIIIITLLDYRYGIATFVFVFILMFISKLTEKKVISLETDVSNENEKVMVDIGNTFSGLQIIKLNNLENKFLNKTLFSVKLLEKKKFKREVYNSIYDRVSNYIVLILYILVLYYLFNLLINGESPTKVAMIIFFTDQSLSLTNVFPLYNKHKSYNAILDKILINDKYDINSNNKGTNNFKFENDIVLKNVSYKHDDKVILNKVNLTVEKGKKYLIRGKSGEGKSTLLKILSRAYEDYEGEIFIDGINYKSVSLDSFNNNISFITQDTFLFEDTLLNNITLYKKYTKEQVNQAIELSGLNNLLNDGKSIDSIILNENGKNLSGGERQRISIARSIIKDTDIVFVDECTSSLDKELALNVENTLLNLEATVMEISHRTYEEVLNKYDYIIELNNGQIHQWSPSNNYMEVLNEKIY